MPIHLFRQLHGELRAAVDGLDHHGINWTPGDDTNSVATLIVHVLGSEAEALALAAREPVSRDRAAEFVPRVIRRDELYGRLDAADAQLIRLGGRVDENDPMLVTNYAHAREHLGQVLLTGQLYRQARQRARA